MTQWATRAKSVTAPDRRGKATPREAREQLHRLARALADVDEQLSTLSGPAEQALERQFPHSAIPVASRLAELRVEWSRRTHAFIKASKKAATTMEVPRNRLANTIVHELVGKLANIYEELTPRRAGRAWDAYQRADVGPFPRFCKACLKALSIPDTGLTSAIEGIAAARREHSKEVASE